MHYNLSCDKRPSESKPSIQTAFFFNAILKARLKTFTAKENHEQMG